MAFSTTTPQVGTVINFQDKNSPLYLVTGTYPNGKADLLVIDPGSSPFYSTGDVIHASAGDMRYYGKPNPKQPANSDFGSVDDKGLYNGNPIDPNPPSFFQKYLPYIAIGSLAAIAITMWLLSRSSNKVDASLNNAVTQINAPQAAVAAAPVNAKQVSVSAVSVLNKPNSQSGATLIETNPTADPTAYPAILKANDSQPVQAGINAIRAQNAALANINVSGNAADSLNQTQAAATLSHAQ